MKLLSLVFVLISLLYMCQAAGFGKDAFANFCPNTPEELAKINFENFRVDRIPGESKLAFAERCRKLIY